MDSIQTCWQNHVDALAQPACFPLPELALLHVSGADARAFLQNQLSCDIDSLDAHHALPGAWCEARGRVLTTLQVLAVPAGYLLLLPTSLAPTLLPRLRMFVLRAQVQIEWLQEATAVVALTDACASIMGIDTAAAAGQVQAHAGGHLLRLHGPRWLLCNAQADALPTDIPLPTANAAQAWKLLSLLADLPQLGPSSSGSFTAHALSLDVQQAVSLKKGCYPGQEVIARTHYRGASKRAVYVLHGAMDTLPEVGSPLHAAAGGEAWGQVVDAARAMDGTVWLTAVARLDVMPQQPSLDGAALQLAGSTREVLSALAVTAA